MTLEQMCMLCILFLKLIHEESFVHISNSKAHIHLCHRGTCYTTANLTTIQNGTQVTYNTGTHKAGTLSTMGDLDLNDLSFAHTEILLEHGGIGDLKVDNVMFSFLPRGNLYCGYGSAWRETKRNDRCRVAVAF